MTDAERIAELEGQVASLRQLLAEALALVAELQAQLGQDSHNSHWSSSRDKNRRQQTKSLRTKSGKKPGGQEGHSGQTLKLVAEPDHVEVHRPVRCRGCGVVWNEQAAMQLGRVSTEYRQVFDIPPIQLEVTEHRTASVICSVCHVTTCGAFPADVKHAVQYGPHIKAFSVYLNQQQMVPLQRLHALLGEWLQAPLSPGSIVNWVQEAAAAVAEQVARIQTGLQQAPVVHCDETGQYIAGKRFWLHVAATTQLTLYRPHAKRGRAGTDALGILRDYQGVAVHDGFPSYRHYGCGHALCNVHHLRELTAVHERGEQAWAAEFITFLCALKEEVEQACATGLTALPSQRRQAIGARYQTLIDAAYQANPPPVGGWPAGKRGRKRKPKALNLAERLDNQRSEVLAFVDNFTVPFDNNLVERDIRMVKVQQKISGCFRSWTGAEAHADLRSYLSTLCKQGHSASHALKSIFSGNLIPVALAE